ncbi:MAG: 3-isopropylmalate dehydratase small subunit [Lysobacteraceae bacterium]
MKPLRQLRSRTVCLPEPNIDTDRIIPARFLTTTEREGLGRFAFHDARRRDDGSLDPDFALNTAAAKGAEILVAGRNFGCGSSREHAPWALLDLGLRAVISSEIADIFRSNALKNGLLAITLPAAVVDQLLASPGSQIELDVERCVAVLSDGSEQPFELDAFARTCLLDGVDPLGWLLAQQPNINQFEESRHAR